MMNAATKTKRHGVLVSASGNLLVVQFRKPGQTILVQEHEDGTRRTEILTGDDVPNPEDWEALADALWIKSEHSAHGPIAQVWMEEVSGGLYLTKLSYGGQRASW